MTHAPRYSGAIRPAVIGMGRVFGASLTAVSAFPVDSKGHHGGDEEEGGTSLWILAVSSMVLVLLGGKHWVLVTLLLSNVIVNESLPVVLDRTLGGGVAAVVGSTVLIVIFGEIVPQSICVRFGLPIGGYMSTPVLLLMYITAPVSWPIAKLLDWILGEDHGTLYKKSGLKTLVTLHKSLGELSERLNQDEVTIITAVLDLKDKPVAEVMTPISDVYTLAEDHVLDEKTMDDILSSGYSRIPIYRSGNHMDFVGMLLVKTLITYDPEDRIPVREVPLGAIVETRPETSCLDIINFFQEGKSHMVLVSEFPGSDHGALGVVTLEDVIEELIGEEIVDESDVYVDVHKAIRRLTPAPRARRLQASAAAAAAVASKKAPDAAILVDVGEHNDTPNIETASFHSNYEGGFHNAAKSAIHMKRRTSDGGIEGTPVVVKASLDEMRSQLRLGPANRASNPRNNKRSLFKIKQGLGANQTPPGEGSRPLPPRAASHMGFTNPHGHPHARSAGHERTPLLGEDHEEAVEDEETQNGNGHGPKTNGAN
ncbi:hypothetical protein FSARC_7208 [Fusarium sarcochroum]|uniref:CNNM transmembrane domain-containing protein n=1 Tax=Fusarium sarcochroum TaxID=1208366 RepID=A0A8H4X8K6_9HYPO|nr:hypothetical protein FSARC_7208 [Fusarium sarcochroum]